MAMAMAMTLTEKHTTGNVLLNAPKNDHTSDGLPTATFPPKEYNCIAEEFNFKTKHVHAFLTCFYAKDGHQMT